MMKKSLSRLSMFTLALFCCGTLLAAPLFGLNSTTSKQTTFTPTQQKAIEQIVHHYLVSNPHVLIEASQALQAQSIKKMIIQGIAGVKAHPAEVFRNKISPVAGDLKGKITLVMFSDYQCMHCRQMNSALINIMKNNPNLRVVFKEWPIFGPPSLQAAKAAMAANEQGKYLAFREALMTSQQRMDMPFIMHIAKNLKLNIKKFKQDMQNPAFTQEIQRNNSLAINEMHMVGTPAFVVGPTDATANSKNIQVFPGACPAQQLQVMINLVKNG